MKKFILQQSDKKGEHIGRWTYLLYLYVR